MVEYLVLFLQAVLFALIIFIACLIRLAPVVFAIAGTWAAVAFSPDDAAPFVGIAGLVVICGAAFALPLWGELLGAMTEGKRKTLE